MGKIRDKLSYLFGLAKKHGVVGLGMKYIEKKTEKTDQYYRRHYEDFLPTEEELQKQRKSWRDFSYCPKISIVVPTYRTPELFLRELLDSVIGQSYDSWELCIADGSCDSSVHDIIMEYLSCDTRIVYVALDENGGISKNTNEGFRIASGEYIGLLDHDDVLAKNALYEMVKKINSCQAAPLLLYSDEDKVSADGTIHFEPHFKTEFNEELLNHYNYICHFLMFHRSLLSAVKGLNPEFDGAQDYDFVLRCSENLKKEEIAYVAKIVYHWRVHGLSTAGFSGYKDYAYEAGRRAVQEHLNRVQSRLAVNSKVMPAKGREFVNIIPDSSMEEMTNRVIVCLDKDSKPIDAQWCDRLCGDFLHQPGRVGMVGGKMIDGKGLFAKVLTVGYSYRKNGDLFPNFAGQACWKKGYFRKLVVPQNVSAADLRFCVIDRAAYEAVGGFDEGLPHPYKDLDFAFRLRKAGYQVILDAAVVAVLKHDLPDKKISGKEKELMIERWNAYFGEGDPYYNENICGNGHI